MCDPCNCPDCDAKSTIAAWLLTEVWGADAANFDHEDDAALDRILAAIDRHWVGGGNYVATLDRVRAEMTLWLPRKASVQ